MSTPPDDLAVDSPAPPRPLHVALRALGVTLAAISLYLLWSGERVQLRDDLQLVAPLAARPGDPLPLRAFVLRDVEAPEGPSLAQLPVRVRLLDAGGRELARTTLAPTPFDAMEGALRIPAVARGQLVLEASATFAGALPLTCRRALEVAPDAGRLPRTGRAAGPLQQFALGAVQPLGMSPPPAPFLPRISGGACVPEERCTMLVWVGAPAAAISVQPSPAFTLLGPPLPQGEQEGIVELSLRVHGPEAELTLVATRGGEPVARRAVRLPVALGEVAVFSARSVLDGPPEGLALALPPGRSHAILDVFSDDRLWASVTVADVVAEQPLARPPALPAGLVRVQARVDRFSSEGAGGRMLYVRRGGESPEAVLAAVVSAARGAPGGDELSSWLRAPPAFVTRDLDRSAAFALAPLDGLRLQVPPAASGRPAQVARIEREKRLVRYGVSSLLALAALIVGFTLARRGLGADEEARAILEEADRATDAGELPLRPSGAVWVITLSLCVVLAFLAGALLIASKSLWF